MKNTRLDPGGIVHKLENSIKGTLRGPVPIEKEAVPVVETETKGDIDSLGRTLSIY